MDESISFSTCWYSALCVMRPVTIEAATPGTVTFDAQGSAATPRRVIFISPPNAGDEVSINGIIFTGGYMFKSCDRSSRCSEARFGPLTSSNSAGSNYATGGCVLIEGEGV